MRRLVGLERLHSQFWVVGFRVFVVLSDAWTGQNVVRVFVFARFRVFVSSCFRVLVLTLLTASCLLVVRRLVRPERLHS